MKQLKKKLIVSIIFIIVLLLTMSYATTKKYQCDKKLIVKSEKVKETNLKKYRKFQGKFVFETVSIGSQVEGIVTDIKVSEGDFVSKGAILIVLNDNFSDKIKTIETEINKWKRILKRRKMWKVRSPRAEAQAEKKIKENTDLLEKTKEEAQKYNIKASVNGKIKTIKVNIGDNVKVGDTVVEMTSKANLYSKIKINKKTKSFFKNDMEIKVKNKKSSIFYKAKVKNISSDFVVLWIKNSENKINESFNYCFKLFEKEYNNHIIFPKNIVKEDKKGKFVYLLREKRELLGIIKKTIAKKQYINILDNFDGKYVLNKDSKVNTKDYVIVSGIIAGKTIPANKCVCLRNGVIVKVLHKGEKIKLPKTKKAKKRRIEKVGEKKIKVVEKKKESVKKETEKKEQAKIEKKEIKKAPSRKTVKKIAKKEHPFLNYLKNNKLLINYDKIITSHNYPNEYIVRVLGENLNTDRLIQYINTIKYKRFCVSKSKDYTIFSAYFIEPKKGGKYKKHKEEYIGEIGIEKIKKFDFKTSFGIGFNKSSDIENIASYLNRRGISPIVSSNNIYLLPTVEFIYNLGVKTSLGLEFSYLFRNHNFNGTYKEAISDDITANYEFSDFVIKDKNIMIQSKFYYTLWKNEIYSLKGSIGAGLYFANFNKEKTLNFSIKTGSDTLNSYKYEEAVKAKTLGFLFSFGAELSRKIGENINIFISTGGYFPLKGNWKGDMSYNLPSSKTISGNLYFVSYNDEKYLWVLDDEKFNELNETTGYSLSKPLVSTNKLIFRIALGLSLKF